MTRIEVLAPLGFRHHPAQHCFLRFPSISVVDNHPFTIVSAPPLEDVDVEGTDQDREDDAKPHRLVFLARTHDGFTRRLADYCASRTDILASAWIDGPYGGVDRPIEQLYDQLILVAGGSGITACIPWLEHVVSRSRMAGGDRVKVKRVVLHWVMKMEEHFAWLEDELRIISQARSQSNVVIDMKFYVTGGNTKSPFATTKMKESVVVEKDGDVSIVPTTQSSSPTRHDRVADFTFQRPTMDTILLNLDGDGKTFVFGCGPESLRKDLSNACADAQVRVLKGTAQEVAMHLEAFGW